MKSLINVIVWLLCISSVYPQATFEYMYSSLQNEISRSLIEDDEGNIIFSVENFEYGLLIKLDQNGSFIDSIRIENPEGTCNLAELIKIDENQFVVFGNWTTDTNSSLWYMRFDNDLQIVDDKKLNSNEMFIFEFHHIINQNGNIVIIGHYVADPQDEFDVCMYEININGDVIRNMFFNAASTYNHAYTLLENKFDNNYKVFAKSPLSSALSRTFCCINIVDSNFNFIDSSPIDYPNIENNSCAKWLNDSIYFLAGKWLYYAEPEWDVGIVKVTRTDSVISSNSFGRNDTVDNPGNYHCLDFITPDNIFFGWTSNSYMYPFQNDPSWIMLTILDSNLNIKSQNQYGGDAFYIVNSVLATQDSGCVISCSRYDHLTQFNEWDVYILKVNKDGLLVSTPENPVINANACYLYPNPGSEQLNVNCPHDGLGIQLFDIMGRIKMTALLKAGNNPLPASNLTSGIYLYRITYPKNQVVQSGKWLKK
jgi:hypothetical protein